MSGCNGREANLGSDGPQVRLPPIAALRGGGTNWRNRPEGDVCPVLNIKNFGEARRTLYRRDWLGMLAFVPDAQI
jgi:hypothetical protein